MYGKNILSVVLSEKVNADKDGLMDFCIWKSIRPVRHLLAVRALELFHKSYERFDAFARECVVDGSANAPH